MSDLVQRLRDVALGVERGEEVVATNRSQFAAFLREAADALERATTSHGGRVTDADALMVQVADLRQRAERAEAERDAALAELNERNAAVRWADDPEGERAQLVARAEQAERERDAALRRVSEQAEEVEDARAAEAYLATVIKERDEARAELAEQDRREDNAIEVECARAALAEEQLRSARLRALLLDVLDGYAHALRVGSWRGPGHCTHRPARAALEGR